MLVKAVIDPYAVPEAVERLQVADSSVVRDIVVEVVLNLLLVTV